MKQIVETVGATELMIDGTEEGYVPADRPAVVRPSNIINHRASLNRLRVLANVGDAATNAALKETIANSVNEEGVVDWALVISSMLAEFPVDGVKADPTLETKSTTKPKAAK